MGQLPGKCFSAPKVATSEGAMSMDNNGPQKTKALIVATFVVVL
jgi:hypothetical protein